MKMTKSIGLVLALCMAALVNYVYAAEDAISTYEFRIENNTEDLDLNYSFASESRGKFIKGEELSDFGNILFPGKKQKLNPKFNLPIKYSIKVKDHRRGYKTWKDLVVDGKIDSSSTGFNQNILKENIEGYEVMNVIEYDPVTKKGKYVFIIDEASDKAPKKASQSGL